MSEIIDDKAQVRVDLDLSRARWQRPDGSEPAASGADVVELAFVEHTDGQTYVAMRQHDTALVFTPSEWDAFVRGAKDGEFDQPW